jgi:RNA polymerase sigma-70 factor (ECF subfamily)
LSYKYRFEQLKDKTLINNIINNKKRENSFKLLFEKYKKQLYWHIRGIVKNHEDSDDVLQNTFIKIYKNIDKYKGEAKLYTWMYRIATNESINFINKKAKYLNLSIEDYQYQLGQNLETDVFFDGDKAQLKLQQAILTLPTKQQIVFNMKYFEEKKYHEISEILETSVGALKASYHHAVKKIEKIILNTDL